MDSGVEKSSFLKANKNFDVDFFEGKSKNHKKILSQRKVGILIVKVKKFGVVWYIPRTTDAR